MTVPAGQTSAPFTITAGAVPQRENVIITAALNGDTTAAPYTVGPKQLILNISTPSQPAVAGRTLQSAVRLWTGPTNPGGTVTLTSENPALSVPATVQIPPGASGVGFTATLTRTTPPGTVITVTATCDGITATRTITLP